MLISSLDNPRVKLLRQLHRRRGRQRAGLYLLEGLRILAAAIDAGIPLDPVLYGPELLRQPDGETLLERLRAAGARPLPATPAVLRAVAATEQAQGVVAAAPIPQPSPLAFWAGDPLMLVADRIQDPGNLGTMVRSAVAAGASLWLTPGCVDLFNPKTVRATAGALFHLRWWMGQEDPPEAIDLFRQKAIAVVVASLRSELPYDHWDFTRPTAMVIGNEASGADPRWEAHADARLLIPMQGPVESLNAAMAATVFLFEAARQRRLAGALPV